MQSATTPQLKRLHPELLIWPLALAGLALMHPEHPYPGICPLKWLGASWCPGCGLGRSVSYLLHGNLAGSWQTHKLGVFALAVLLHRTVTLAIDTIPFKAQGPAAKTTSREQVPITTNTHPSNPSKTGPGRQIPISTHKTIKTPI